MFSPALLYLNLFLLLLTGICFIISLFFLSQRKPQQRIFACLFGVLLYLLAITGFVDGMYHNYDVAFCNRLLKTIGFFWVMAMLLWPAKQAKNDRHRINNFALIFLWEWIANVYTYLHTLYQNYNTGFETRYLTFEALSLAWLLAGITLFYFRKPAGWLMLLVYYQTLALYTLAYVGWIVYEQRVQHMYKIALSGFTCVYLAYYLGCLYFLSSKKTRSPFSLQKKYCMQLFC